MISICTVRVVYLSVHLIWLLNDDNIVKSTVVFNNSEISKLMSNIDVLKLLLLIYKEWFVVGSIYDITTYSTITNISKVIVLNPYHYSLSFDLTV